MRYPNFLQPGGTIGFVAPSFGCSIEPYRSGFIAAQEKFTKMGYKMDLGPNCYEGSGIGISSSPQKCGEELTEYYCSVDNDVLISCGGGELMCETMDYVDFEKIKSAEPKWFMGFSDNTNMTFLLATLCDCASMYGPCAAAYGMRQWHPALQDAINLLTGVSAEVNGYDKWEKESLKDEEHPLEPYHLTEDKILKVYKEGKLTAQNSKDAIQQLTMQGRLIGGCVDCLVTLLGTKYDQVESFLERYKEDGCIWFLECCDLNVMSIRRAFWQMKQAGWFQYAKGFLIGRPLCYGEELMGLDQYQAVTGVLKELDVPVILDVDLGHLPPMMPLVTGSEAMVRMEKNDIKISMQMKV